MTQSVDTIAKGIGDVGMMAVTAAFFLILTGLLWVACFKWFKSIIDNLLKGHTKMVEDLLTETRKQNDMLIDISDSLRPESLLEIKTISNAFFDLAVHKILRLIKRVKKENHIDHKDKTLNKIKKSIANLHADRKSKFDCFTYRGKKLSEYVNPEWADMVTEVVEKEVYDEDPNEERSYTNVKNAYDEIKVDFYNRLNRS